MEGFFAQHVGHGASERSKGGVLQHLQLKFAVTIDEIGVSEKVHPVIDVDIEGTQQTLVLKSATLEHLLCFDFAGVAEVIYEQSAHLPSVAHLFDHDARERPAVPVSRSCFK